MFRLVATSACLWLAVESVPGPIIGVVQPYTKENLKQVVESTALHMVYAPAKPGVSEEAAKEFEDLQFAGCLSGVIKGCYIWRAETMPSYFWKGDHSDLPDNSDFYVHVFGGSRAMLTWPRKESAKKDFDDKENARVEPGEKKSVLAMCRQHKDLIEDRNAQGEFKSFDFGDFTGTLSNETGTKYEDAWPIRGRITLKNGDVYIGTMFGNKRQGMGAYYYQNGDFYSGLWHNDKKEGWGSLYYSDASASPFGQPFTHEGAFKADLQHGASMVYTKDGKTKMTVTYDNGKQTGPAAKVTFAGWQSLTNLMEEHLQFTKYTEKKAGVLVGAPKLPDFAKFNASHSTDEEFAHALDELRETEMKQFRDIIEARKKEDEERAEGIAEL